MEERVFKLEELAEEASVSARTVRYYVQRGLLPKPDFRGRDTVYTEEHLLRLRAIRRLQERFLPLDAIQTELLSRSLEELRELAEGRDFRSPAGVTVEVGGPYRGPAWQPPTGGSVNAGRSTVWQRLALAPGLELHLSVDADPRVHALANEVRALVEARSGSHSQGGRR